MSDLTVTRWVSSTPSERWHEESPAAGPGLEVSDLRLRISGARQQTWRGFGGCFNELGWKVLATLGAAERRQVLQALFDDRSGCAFNLCRLPIGANDYAESWYSHNETPGDFAMKQFSIERDRRSLIPYIREARQLCPRMKLFASPWSPPTWLKRPPVYNNGTLIWEQPHLRAYALYFLKFVRAYRQEGITIDQVHVQNEPDSDQKFPSCKMSGEQMRDFIRDYLGPLFQRENEPCEIWAGTLERSDVNAWVNPILCDARARAFVRGLGFQWAGKGAVQRAHQSWPELPILQTENECGDGHNTWAYAQYVFSLVHHYVANGAAGYVYWNMVLQPGGVSTWGWPQNSMITIDPDTGRVEYQPEFYVMKHFAHFVRPEAVALAVEGPWAANAVAFATPDSGILAVVANPFQQAVTVTLESGGASRSLRLPADSFNTICLADR
jgi:glucosylceramidase